MLKQHYTVHSPLPKKGNDQTINANWLAIERTLNANLPSCVTATGNPGTIAAGTPGAFSNISWSPTALPLNDRFNMIGASASSALRIPVDGYYDFWFLIEIDDDIHTATYEMQTKMQNANTSDTGIGAPSYSDLILGPSKTFINAHIDTFLPVLYRGVELHANDLVRFQIRIYTAGAALTATTVTQSEFRFTYPIPNAGT